MTEENTPVPNEQIGTLIERLNAVESALRTLKTADGNGSIESPPDGSVLLSQAQEALAESQTRYRRLVNRMSAIVFELAPDGTTRFVNDAVSRITGYQREELGGGNWWNTFFPGERHREAEELLARLHLDDVTNEEVTLTSKAGSLITLELNSANRYRPDQTLESIVGFGIDITERKWVEKRLRRSERHFRSLIENALDVITVLNADGTIRYESPSAETVLGYKPGEVIGKEIFEFIHPDDAGSFRNAILYPFRDHGHTSSVEFRLRHQNGEWRIFEGIGKHLLDDPAIEGIILNSRDITERKWAEQRLERSEKHFRSLIENALDIITILNSDGTIRYESPSIERVLGYKPEDLIGKSAFAFIHPEALPIIMNVLSQAWEAPGMTASLEFRFRHKDGSWRLLEAVGKNLIKDPVIGGAVINSRDITERRRAEEQRRESDERFRQIAENIREVFWMTDLESGQILYVSPGYEVISGRTRESVYQNPKSWLEWIHPDDRERVLGAAIERRICGEYDEEYRIVRPDGAIRWIRNSAVPVKDNSGRCYRVAGIAEDITDRKQAEEQIWHMAYYDTLTGLPNRLLLHDRVRQAIAEAERESKSVALLLIDLDHFKEINDTLGHHHGDVLLQQVGARLRSSLWLKDVVARLGGDEFGILLPLSDSSHARLAADKIVSAMEPPFLIEGLPVVVEPSIGIALFPDHGATADILFQRADVAMYVAKQGGSGYVIYDTKRDQHSPRRLALMGEMRGAIEGDQLFLEYQPKVDLRTGRVAGVEALVRWRHPEKGIIPPAEFIPLAERSGLIKSLTLWVLKTANRQYVEWRRSGLHIPIAVNLSARCLQDPQLLNQMADFLGGESQDPDWLGLEITESVLMADPDRAMNILTSLSGMGVGLSIDDFGTGYSSLSYLKRLPVTEIKIDKSFVMNMTADENDAAIVHSTIGLAHSMGRIVVAEGVENQETLDRLKALGCDVAQGFFVSRPIPAKDFTRWLKESPYSFD